MKTPIVKNLTFVIILTLVAAFGVIGCDEADQEQPVDAPTIEESPVQIVPTLEPEPPPVVEVPTPPVVEVPTPPVVEVPTPPVVEVPTPPECVTNADCSDGRLCTEGKCVAAEMQPPLLPECATSEDCGDGKACTDGKCVAIESAEITDVYGNPWQGDGVSELRIGRYGIKPGTGIVVSNRFSAMADGLIDHIILYLPVVAPYGGGDRGIFDFAIHENNPTCPDDETKIGCPSDTVVAYSNGNVRCPSGYPHGCPNGFFTVDKWTNLEPLEKGKTYHLVMKNMHEHPNENYSSVDHIWKKDDKEPIQLDSAVGKELHVLFRYVGCEGLAGTFTEWRSHRRTPIQKITLTNNSSFGQSFYAFPFSDPASLVINSDDRLRQNFKVGSNTMTAKELSIRLNKKGDYDGDLSIEIYEVSSDSQILLATVQIEAKNINTVQNWYTAKIEPPIQFKAGIKYNITISSPEISCDLNCGYEFHPMHYNSAWINKKAWLGYKPFVDNLGVEKNMDNSDWSNLTFGYGDDSANILSFFFTVESELPPIDHSKEIAIIKKIWASPSYFSSTDPDKGYGKAYYIDLINKIPDPRYGGYTLYNVQIALMNLLLLAIDSGDMGLISDLCDVVNAAYPHVRTIDGSYPFKDKPLVAVGLSDVTWVDESENIKGKYFYENMNVISQWLYFVSSLVNGVASIPGDHRTDSMKLLLTQYTPLLKQIYARLLFAEGDPTVSLFASSDTFHPSGYEDFGFIGWKSCVQNPDVDYQYSKHHFRVILTKLADGYNKEIGYCNKLLDTDVQMLSGLVEYLSAHKRDPSSVEFDSANEQRYQEHIKNIITLVEEQHVHPQLKTASSSSVQGFLVKPGAYTEHPSYIYAGFENDTHPPTLSDINKVADLADDVSHFMRYSWVLRTLALNKNIAGSGFPEKPDIEGLANQIAYAVFNGNLDEPQFKTYMNGSNGWYRTSPMDNITGLGPNSGAAAIIVGGYILYAQFNQDLQKVADRLWEIFNLDKTEPENAPYVDIVDSYYCGWEEPNGGKCVYDKALNKWSETCICKNYPFGLEPESNQSGNLLKFLAAYVNGRKF